jgi:SAM-dependent methyltransferase
MTTATDRLVAEQAFHDGQARARSTAFLSPKSLWVSDSAYLDHETWIRPAFDSLGDLCRLSVLDYGCGHGMAAVVMARQGACVTGVDLSAAYLEEARKRAEANGVTIDYVQANGENLPFANDSFDRIWGNAILHHLDLHRAAVELRRILRPGGVAVFCEPWGGNPLLNLARRLLPYPGKSRTTNEQPLGNSHVRLLGNVFGTVTIQGFQLLGMARRILPYGRFLAAFDRIDALLLSRLPILNQFCRYVVITVRR